MYESISQNAKESRILLPILLPMKKESFLTRLHSLLIVIL